MNRLEQQLAAKLEARALAGNLRRLTTERAAVDFYSNDYLGLATSGALSRMIAEKYADAGKTGSTGARLLSGNSREMEELEEIIARFHKSEAALLFNSGYDANTGLIAAIADRHTTIIYDELCHASIIDGVRLSICAGKYKFRHNDLDDLAEKLQRYHATGSLIVIVEAVYSMDGDMASLKGIVKLCNSHNAQLIVDEAHATGIFGGQGEGLVCALGLQEQVFARVHTFGKALGCQGAVVTGSNLLKQYLINFARSFIYTTAASQYAIRAINCAYQYLSTESFTNHPLHELIGYFRNRVKETGSGDWKDSESAIQAYILRNDVTNISAAGLARIIQQAGLQVNAILHPTVPKGMERLRVCLHTFNTQAEIDNLLEIVAFGITK